MTKTEKEALIRVLEHATKHLVDERNGEEIAGSSWNAVKIMLKTAGCAIMNEFGCVILVKSDEAKRLLNELV